MKYYIFLIVLMACSCKNTHYDIVIIDGTVIDGTNSPPVKQDIGIIGDEIVTVGLKCHYTADDTIDAGGLIGSAEEVGTPRCVAEGRTQSYLLWEGDEPWDQLGILRPLVGRPLLEDVSRAFEPMTRGVTLS